MKLALTAGGTGGHILPAIAVLDALRSRDGLLTEVRFFGPDDRGERATVESHGVVFVSVPAAAVRGRGPLSLVRSFARLAWGVAVAFRRLRGFGPDAVFSTGGYASFPASLAARVLRRPLVVYLPDVTPGWAVRAEKRLATRIATTTGAALAHLPEKKTRVTGYPVRARFFELDRARARAAIGLDATARMLLVAGATQGAKAINEAIFAATPGLCGEAVVYHVTGPADIARARAVRAALPEDLRGRYFVDAFREDLPDLMLAADLGVFRAGASVLGEVPAASLPAVLVPGRYAGGHQRDNARWLEEGGAAEVVPEDALPGLPSRLLALLGDDARLAAMRESARALARPGAADAIADLIVEVAKR